MRRSKFWGRGLAVEAASVVIRYTFQATDAKGLSAGHHPDNRNSKKVLERLGFRYTHDEYFPALAMSIPYYFLPRLDEERRVRTAARSKRQKLGSVLI